jgi:hypothetical protein
MSWRRIVIGTGGGGAVDQVIVLQCTGCSPHHRDRWTYETIARLPYEHCCVNNPRAMGKLFDYLELSRRATPSCA